MSPKSTSTNDSVDSGQGSGLEAICFLNFLGETDLFIPKSLILKSKPSFFNDETESQRYSLSASSNNSSTSSNEFDIIFNKSIKNDNNLPSYIKIASKFYYSLMSFSLL